MELYPVILEPAYKDYIWGGSRIPALFDRTLPPGIYAESWEISDRPEGMCRVANGPLQGTTLADLVQRFGAHLLGSGVRTPGLPLLVKLIDARERLSIQVHPDDACAARGLGEAKTEAWHILDAPPGAKVFAGVRPGVTSPTFLTALRETRLESCLQEIPVATGDTIFIPGGRLHAICEGLLILEVQQNSNTTYRVYDWGRVGQDGKPRELHLEQALQVIRWNDEAPVKTMPRPRTDATGAVAVELVASPYFRLERLEFANPFTVEHDGAAFEALFTSHGPVEVVAPGGNVSVPRGRTCLIPAKVNHYSLRTLAGRTQVLRISLPRPA